MLPVRAGGGLIFGGTYTWRSFNILGILRYNEVLKGCLVTPPLL